MDVSFDGRIFHFQKAGGINRYFSEIISGLPQAWRPTIIGADEFGSNIPRHPNLRTVMSPQFRPRRLTERFNRFYWRPQLSRCTNFLHPTYYFLTSNFELSDFKCPIVTTVYDMIYARFSKQAEASELVVRAQKDFVLRADRIICISKYTETDLIELIPEAAGKTAVIYLGSSFERQKAATETIFEEPTFLFVGGRGGYKNFFFLLRAFARAVSINSSIRLCVAGAPLTSEEKWQIYFLGISEHVKSIIYPDEETLKQIYCDSVALLYPSRYEGFGIPPLEAMACGTVAVSGNLTSLPEVVGDGGIMLDPADEDAWSECIIKLSRPFSERDDLLKRGHTRLEKFSWNKCVRQHVDLYKSFQ